MGRFLRWLVVLIIVGAAVYWVVTRPDRVDAAALEGLEGDPERGAQIFAAAGCAACHAAPEADDEARLELAGGQAFATQFGTFHAPNISSSESEGIGGWTLAQFADAVTRGITPGGSHYYPAFPYTSYNKMRLEDVADLFAYFGTLPAVETPSQPHDVSFPFDIRRNLGGWKWLFESREWVLTDPPDEQVERGRYLVEALGHCGECHTPRNALGGLDRSAWLGGAPNPAGKGRIPNITTGGLSWSAGDIAEYLKSGFTPDFDTAGGEMAAVVEETSKLSDEDRAAIAAYVKAVPAVAEDG